MTRWNELLGSWLSPRHRSRCVSASTLLFIIASISAHPTRAMRAEENAVTTASDAFGTVVGKQTIGLYSPTNARGFSPTQAENIRIEGLYFDQQTTQIDPYVFSGSDMRIGLGAQAYAFPSPSGIVDLKLRIPATTESASLVIDRGPLGQNSAEVDAQHPFLTPLSSLGATVAIARDFDYNSALNSSRRAVALELRFEPVAGTTIIPFVGYIRNSEDRETPYVYSDRIHPLPLFDEQLLPTQSWTGWTWNQLTAGLIAKCALRSQWEFRAGIFRSKQDTPRSFADLLLGALPDGRADHAIDTFPQHAASSYSGDFRLTRLIGAEGRRGELTFTARGRDTQRRFGGDSLTDFGTTSIFANTSIPQPPITFTSQSADHVQQTGAGLSYNERWGDIASGGVGLLVTDYNRKIQGARTEHSTAVLPNISFAAKLLKAVTAYGSYTRGLEDSTIAPYAASNRGEPPPATPTWQVDSGINITPRQHLQAFVGVFRIHKTYFGTDTVGHFGQIGAIGSQGVEFSAALSEWTGLTVIAGGVWLKPEVHRQIAEQGGSGPIPVGPVPRTLNINLDYAPPRLRGWGTSLQWTALSSRVETADNLYRLPPLETMNVGLRYIGHWSQRTFSARLDAANVTNARGLTLSSDYVALPQLRRNYTLTVAIDL
jgi:iron complex outermembrane recepter protein